MLLQNMSQIFVKIDHEIFSTVILFLLLIQEGLFTVKVCAQSKSTFAKKNSVGRLTDHADMTTALVLTLNHRPDQTNILI